MAKQKRKVTEVTEKKNKKLKKASANEKEPAPEAAPAPAGAQPQVGTRSLAALTSVPRLEGEAGGVRRAGADEGASDTQMCSVPSESIVGQIRTAVHFRLDSMPVFGHQTCRVCAGYHALKLSMAQRRLRDGEGRGRACEPCSEERGRGVHNGHVWSVAGKP
ncbi:hypothetical protein PAL_GLEAN10002654 [Pteropus alecto]|uniref:Uncharacterized protein n=1 Tax=Pteropus alecto TaxID=9402 RepID=L5KFD5_PTEAL|nr:hypothetical protein PAL_GLEAN10002654 [Pteropus alecto]